MKKLKGFMLLMFCCLFSAVIALSACSSKGDTSTSSSDGGTSSTTDSSSVDVSSSGGDSSSVDDSSSDGGSSGASSSDDGSSSGGSSSSADETNYDTMLESITVDASGAKTSYALGEEFSSEGIVVNATTSVNFLTSTSAVTGYTVDSSNFDSSKVGTYTIYVTYALPANPQAFQNAEYTVTVSSSLPVYANIKVVYSGDTQYTYNGTDVTIDLSSEKITATSYVGDDAANLTAEEVTDYDLYYSVNSGALTKIEGTSIKASHRGTYSFYVVKDYVSGTESIEMSGQFIVYVVDAPASFAYNKDGTTSYGEDPEESDIGTDWTYTLTLASGATESLGYADVTFDPNTSPGSNTVTVTYVDEYTCLVQDTTTGEYVVTTITNTYTASVAYSVEGEVIATNVVLNISDLLSGESPTLSATTYTAGVTMYNDNATSIGFTASSSATVEIDSNGKSADGYSFSYRIKLGGQGSADARSIKVTTAGACKIVVYMMSSSSGATRDVGMYQNVITTSEDGTQTATFTLIGSTQTVSGSSLVAYTYDVSATGTYYIASTSGGLNVYGVLVTY